MCIYEIKKKKKKSLIVSEKSQKNSDKWKSTVDIYPSWTIYG